MAKYANQKTISIAARTTPRDKQHPYCTLNIDIMQQVMSKLNKIGALKMWLYLNKNVNNYVFDLSRAELISKWGFTKDTYKSGLEELCELGYLTPLAGNDNVLVFHEVLQEENPTKEGVLSENPTILDTNIEMSENPTKELDLEENPTKEIKKSENPTVFKYGDFVF